MISDKIVIGGTLEALVFAALNDYPVIFVEPKMPHIFENFENGDSKYEMWVRCALVLSASGRHPCGQRCQTIRIEDNVLKAFDDSSKIHERLFTEAYIFDEAGIIGLNAPEIDWDHEEEFQVIDWINVRSGATHEFDFHQTDDKFVNKIYFYPSDRIDGKTKCKDIAAFSYLTHEQLNDFGYSDTMTCFKVKSLMKDLGIRGTRNGRDTKNPNKYKYYAIKLESAGREVKKIYRPPTQDTELLKYRYDTIEELMASLRMKETYSMRLMRRLSEIGK